MNGRYRAERSGSTASSARAWPAKSEKGFDRMKLPTDVAAECLAGFRAGRTWPEVHPAIAGALRDAGPGADDFSELLDQARHLVLTGESGGRKPPPATREPPTSTRPHETQTRANIRNMRPGLAGDVDRPGRSRRG